MTATYKWDGFALDSTNSVSTDGQPTDQGPIEIKLEQLLRGGMGLKSNLLRGRKVKLSGVVRGSTAANFETNADALRAKLHQVGEKVLQLSDDRYLDCFAAPGALKLIEGTGKDEPGADWSCEFLSKDAYWRNSAQTTDTQTNTSTTVQKAVTNGGDAPEFPDFEVENTGLSAIVGITLTIRNNTTSKEFRLFDFDLAAGDKLFVSASTGQVYLADTPDASSNSPKRIDGAYFSIQSGSNTLEFEANDGSGDLTYRILHYDRFHHYGDLG